MNIYISAKVVKAEPMTKYEFQAKYKYMDVDINDAVQEGYHVQYLNQNGSVYDSWCPKCVFEEAYKKLMKSELDFLVTIS